LPDQRLEAADFFWVRGWATGTLPELNRFARCLRTLESFIRGSSSPKRARDSGSPKPVATCVALVPNSESQSWELSIEAADRPGELDPKRQSALEQALRSAIG
jgi:hypothetical protein